MVSLIVAMDQEGGIGKSNSLMWRLPGDMKFFKETTLNKVVIMGRKTYDSLPSAFKPLPQRTNIVITRDQSFSADGCLIYYSLESAIHSFKDIFIIGGGMLYAEALQNDLVDQMFITSVQGTFGADTFFSFDKSNWNEELLLEQAADEKHSHGFSISKYTKR